MSQAGGFPLKQKILSYLSQNQWVKTNTPYLVNPFQNINKYRLISQMPFIFLILKYNRSSYHLIVLKTLGMLPDFQ